MAGWEAHQQGVPDPFFPEGRPQSPIVSTLFEVDTGREAVYRVCQAVLVDGAERRPRGMLTRELCNVRIVMSEPWDALPTGINREKLKPAIGVLEALQNISGRSYLPLFKRMVPASAKWDDDVPTYGERLGDQLEQCFWALTADPDTRQAVALIWRENDIIAGQAHNLCTIGLQFLLRDGMLHCHTTMRSNDAWWGLCYDLFQFTQVQATMANALRVPMGAYVHDAGSMHLYERHFEAAAGLEDPFLHDLAGPPEPPRFGVSAAGAPDFETRGWPAIADRAARLAVGDLTVPDPTPTEVWMRQELLPYQHD